MIRIFRTGTRILLAGMMALVLSCASVSFAQASDSGPWVWDFLLFGNLNVGQNVKADSTAGVVPVTRTGYGLGLGTELWFSDNIAARLLAQADIFASPAGGYSNIKNGPAFGLVPITIGPVFKLFGSTNYFVYAPVDLGLAETFSSGPVGSNGSVSVINGQSFYGDAGIGVNIRFLTIEARVAYVATPNAYSGGFWFFPLSVGFDL
jgi:hypothetical protein